MLISTGTRCATATCKAAWQVFIPGVHVQEKPDNSSEKGEEKYQTCIVVAPTNVTPQPVESLSLVNVGGLEICKVFRASN